MTAYFRTASGTLYQGNVLDILRTLPEQSIYTCVTSPPYWGLRDYGTVPLIWGGLPNCEHIWEAQVLKSRGGVVNPEKASLVPQRLAAGDLRGKGGIKSNYCRICGAWLGSLGLESHPDMFIEHLVEIFREVRRVLRDDGTAWLNLGDTYAGGGYRSSTARENQKGWKGQKQETNKGTAGFTSKQTVTPEGYKSKDLMGIPWRTALALQDDGWYLRQDIIWAKPNPMPESVKDRCTKSHEYIFLLAKSQQYYYDINAIKEPCSPSNISDYMARQTMDNKSDHGGTRSDLGRSREDYMPEDLMRTKRSVWNVTPKPYKGAHFAVFPKELILPCILAGAPKGGAVLDPFFGSGTTGLVCEENDRKWIGIELNPEYCDLAQRRLASIATAKNVLDEVFA
jgi:DNA modification methylase